MKNVCAILIRVYYALTISLGEDIAISIEIKSDIAVNFEKMINRCQLLLVGPPGFDLMFAEQVPIVDLNILMGQHRDKQDLAVTDDLRLHIALLLSG